MKVVIAPDSFKESLSAKEVASAIAEGWQKVLPDTECVCIPMADGGEGTVQSLIDATKGRLQTVEVTAPLGNKIPAAFGISGDRNTAIIEMAAASGLHLAPPEQRNPLITTSYGTGELIKAALDEGVSKIILGIGGSATNDAGAGMLQALGAVFLNSGNQSIGFGGSSLIHTTYADFSRLDKRLQQVEIEVACDVDNPLCGEKGASAVFGPQKGATPAMVAELDHALNHFADIIFQYKGLDIRHCSGSGAAGGMGGGLLTLPNATLKSGVQIVVEAVNLAQAVRDADLVITGEGRMDAQSVHGKTPVGVAGVAKQYGKPVIAIVGCLREDYEAVYQAGIDAVFPIIRQLDTLENVLANGRSNLVSAAQNIAKLYQMQR
ncbi:glycerate kinase [Neisseria animalis]|uniref:Glycerate kinase n=1 Tax=Neisseria animalis TaxID=492 RepID=A0A5P3MTU8_NEIAN|nr:glycerate kinase [Neisseria animalis]QEY25042.1 glycerate kinase [Neisseria animalis]ROW31934.1 glycerate kinase [Neisseria animalis]VEE06966.1 glycerate kinase [Neisseria animalis]